MGRPETDWARQLAMNQLGIGLGLAGHYEDAVSVQEARLSLLRRLGAPEESILATQGNLAITYEALGLHEQALAMKREVYSGDLKLHGEEHENSLIGANNYASTLVTLERFEEAKSLLRKVIPVARRVLGESNELTLMMRRLYAMALYLDTGGTLDDLREAVATLDEVTRTARRVLGGTHPITTGIEDNLRCSRAALRARETPPPGTA